ncbi:MAG: class I SAM-dependent methyltransferase [Longimicrobiales bacterium]
MTAPLRNISDTARWVAVYRARENERADALFRDPFAARLAGEHGEEIAAGLRFAEKNAWSFIARTYLFDRFIRERIQAGADTVVNLAAGLDARPYRLELPSSLSWIEVDLPGIITYKEEVLAPDSPRCRLERVHLDLSDRKARQDLFARIGRATRTELTITEGLLIYLSADEVATLAEDLAANTSFRYWIIDIASPGLLKMLQQQLGPQLAPASAALKFAPVEGPDFFLRHGWKPVAVESFLKTAARLGRVPFPLRLFGYLPESKGRQGARPWSAAVLLERR